MKRLNSFGASVAAMVSMVAMGACDQPAKPLTPAEPLPVGTFQIIATMPPAREVYLLDTRSGTSWIKCSVTGNGKPHEGWCWMDQTTQFAVAK